jgi:hypothetical protein
MKHQANEGHFKRQFEVGDLVVLKLQPYIQSSLAPRDNQNLAFKFFAPFPILQKIGSVAYKLDLPPSAMIHPIFHVSQLKKVVGSSIQVQVPCLQSCASSSCQDSRAAHDQSKVHALWFKSWCSGLL